jgi:hypothetical protein
MLKPCQEAAPPPGFVFYLLSNCGRLGVKNKTPCGVLWLIWSQIAVTRDSSNCNISIAKGIEQQFQIQILTKERVDPDNKEVLIQEEPDGANKTEFCDNAGVSSQGNCSNK